MTIVKTMMNDILNGYILQKEDVLKLTDVNIDELCRCANQLREHFCVNYFDACSIINGKSGRCSEDCKFCSQSAHYKTSLEMYSLIDENTLMNMALKNYEKGILRFSVVTSGKNLKDDEVESLCTIYRKIKNICEISLCASHGLLSYEQFLRLKEAGVERYHCNLETSHRHFPNVCSTHTYEDRISAIKSAQKAGLVVCSGGIIGIGETMEDRIDMAFKLRELDIKSIPLNVLNPIPGTPFEQLPIVTNDEIRRTAAIYRFIAPDAAIRLAGGRKLMPDGGKSVFLSGANAAIFGDMLTTEGVGVDDDMAMIKELGMEVKMI